MGHIMVTTSNLSIDLMLAQVLAQFGYWCIGCHFQADSEAS
eukprot:03463.XXX_145957_146079_1 [CDS] Oithona nana genome sequencing.